MWGPVKNQSAGKMYAVIPQQVQPPSRPLPPQGHTANNGYSSILTSIGQTSLTLSADLFRDFIKKMPSFSLPTASAESVTDVDRLYLAAQDGHDKVVGVLLEKEGINVNQVTQNGATALQIAAQNGHDNVVKLLLEYDGIHINKPMTRDFTALHLAAKNGHDKVVELLLKKKGIKINQVIKDGVTALHLAAQDGHDKVVGVLLEKEGINVNQVTKESATALHLAAYYGHDKVVQLLLKYAVDVNQVTQNGATALHIAAQHGHLNVVKLLLKKKGININQKNKNDFTALHIAAQHGHHNVVELLLKYKGINVNQNTNQGLTVLHIAAQYGHHNVVELLLNYQYINVNEVTTNGATALHVAAENGHHEVVQVLLNNGIDATKTVRDATALHLAAQNGHAKVVKLLIDHKTSLYICKHNGSNALHIAARYGRLEVVQLLLEYGDINVNEKTNQGFTALHIAAQYGHLKLVRLLLKYNGIHVNQVTTNGDTALHLAVQNGHASVVELLTNFIINKGSDDERIGLVNHSIDRIKIKSIITLIKNMQDPNKRDAVLGMISEQKLLAISKAEADARKIVLTWGITQKETQLAGEILEIDKEGWVKKLLPLDPRLQDEAMNKFLSNGDSFFENLHECDKQEIFKLIFNTAKQYPQTTAFILNHHFDWYIGEIQADTRMEGEQQYQKLSNVASVAAAAGVGGVGVAVFYWLQKRGLEDRINKLENEKLENQSRIGELEAEEEKLKSQIGNQNTQEETLKNQIVELETEKSENQFRIGELEADIKKLKSDQAAEKKELNKKVEELTKQVERYVAISITSTLEDTTAKASLEAEINVLKAEVIEKDTHIKALQTQLNYLGTDLRQLSESHEYFKDQVEENQKEKAAELEELERKLSESKTEIDNLNKQIDVFKQKITDMDALLIKYDVLTKEQLAEDLKKALEIATELHAQPERTELDVSLGGTGWTRYLEVKYRDISTDEKRQQLFNNCNRQYDASRQSVGNQWGVFCIGTSHDNKHIKSLEKKCQANDYTFIDLTGKKPGEVVALIKNPHEKKPFFFIKKEAICKESMRYFDDEFPKQKYQQLVDHIATYNNEDNSQDSIDKRIHSFYSNLEIDKEKKYKLAGLLGEFWAVNFFTHLTKSVEDFSIKSTDIPIVAIPASNDSGS